MKCFKPNRGLLVGFLGLAGLAGAVPATPTAWARPLIHYPRRSVVVRERPGAVVVLFPQRVGFWLEKKGPLVRGIERITVGQHEILGLIPGGTSAPVATVVTGGKIRPVRHWAAYLRQRASQFKIPALGVSGHGYPYPSRGALRLANIPLKGRFLGWKREGKWIGIRVATKLGLAEWLVSPTQARVGHRLYRGVQWKLRLPGASRAISVDVEEPFAIQAGDWHFTQEWSYFDQARLGITGHYQLNTPDWGIEHRYFSGRPAFFFAAGHAGATISYFGKVVPAVGNERQAGNRLTLNFQIPVRPGKGVIQTPALKWLFAPGNFSSKWVALNEWTRAFDFTGHYYRHMMGIKRVEPLPMVDIAIGANGGENSWRSFKLGDLINKLPQVAKLGVKVVFFGALDTTATKPLREFLAGSNTGFNPCGVWRTKINPAWGGDAGLKRVCDAAHRLGIKVVLWSASGDLDSSSPLLRAHPNWVAWYANGTPVDEGYSDLIGVSLKRGDLAYVIRQYRKIRQATGFDGVWQDSFLTFGALTDRSAKHPYPRVGGMVKLVRAEQAMGLYVMIEGGGPFGLSSSMGSHSFLHKEYGAYYTCNAPNAPDLEPHSYYRILASKGTVAFSTGVQHFLSAFDQLPAATKRSIIAANHDYMAVLPYMQQRHLIGQGKKWLGVEWLDHGKPRVLFAFTPQVWNVPAGAKVRDVTTGASHSVAPGASGFQAKAWHTYLVANG